MALNEVGPLQFHGPGAKECEEFVAAVSKYAYGQGKLRDDAWIADFVAICLAGDALRWWSALDEQTQGSWRLLRQAMFSRYRPLFYGLGGEEAEQFIFSVRQRVLDAGKQDDNEWILTFVSGCFAGDALRWHVSLDSSIRGDWNLLEVAILAQYPRDSQASASFKIPVPPSAAAPPPKTKNRGRIRVSKKNDTTFSYLSRYLDKDGRGEVTSSIAEALEVEYDDPSTTSSPQTLRIPNGQIIKFDVLGLGWSWEDATDISNFAYICAVNTNSGDDSLDKVWSGPRMTNIWKIASKPSDGSQLFPVTVTVTSGTDFLSAYTSNLASLFWFRTGPYAKREVELSLFFEPL